MDVPGNPNLIWIEIDGKDLSETHLQYIAGAANGARHYHPGVDIMLTVSGFDDDPRDLWEVPAVCRFVMRLLALFHGNGLKPADFRFTQDTLGWLMMCAGVGEIRTDTVTGKRRPVFRKPARH